MPDRWPRDDWLEAIWEDESLKPNERIVAYVYARYAGKGDTSWCSYDEIMRRTGMRSRNAIRRALTSLTDTGWLVVVDEPRQHRSAVYRLTCPLQQYQSGTSQPYQSDTADAEGVEPAVSIRHPSRIDSDNQPYRIRYPREVIERSEERTDSSRDAARSPSGAQPACPRCRGRRMVTISAGCMDRCPDCAGVAA